MNELTVLLYTKKLLTQQSAAASHRGIEKDDYELSILFCSDPGLLKRSLEPLGSLAKGGEGKHEKEDNGNESLHRQPPIF